MIETTDLISFLQIGKSLCDIEIGQARQDVIARFGEQLDQYGEKDYGYFELPKGVRFSYFKDEIDGLAVLNKRKDAVFVLDVPDLLDTFTIGPNTTIHEAIKFLNWSRTKWTIVDTDNKFNLTILTQAGVGLIFDLDDGELMMISKVRTGLKGSEAYNTALPK
jgi:hypothetical protein